MNYKEIQDLLKLVSKSDLAEVRIKDGEFELTIRTQLFNKGKIAPPYTLSHSPMMGSLNAPASQIDNTENTESASEGKISTNEGTEANAGPELIEVKSPIVGTFYRSPSPEKPQYVAVGDSIQEGSVVCIIEAMKLFNEIESEVAGKIVKVLVDDATPVEYDQVLFLVDPKG